MSRGSAAVTLTPAEQARSTEVAALGAAGDVSGLIDRLADPSWTVRRTVVRTLGALGTPAIGPLVEALVSRRDTEARIAATVDALVASSDDVIPALQALVSHPDPAIVADLAQVLGRRHGQRAVATLAPLVSHPDDNVAVATIEALGRIGGPAAVDALIVAVKSDHFFRVYPAIDVLGRAGDPRAIPPLGALTTNPMYQLEVARALGRTGESAAVPSLAMLLSHSSSAVARVAALSLAELEQVHRGKYGSDEAVHAALKAAKVETAAIQRLSRSLSSAEPEEQVALASLLGSIGAEDAAAGLRPLLELGGATAQTAARALRRLGTDGDREVEAALLEGDGTVRLVLLPTVQRAAVQSGVLACLDDADPSVRALACEALARIGALKALPQLFTLLGDANRRVVQAAMAAIQSLGSTEAQTLAIAAASDPRPTVRRSALQVLAYFGFPQTLPVFLAALNDDDIPAREAALQGLAVLSVPQALEALLAQSLSTNDKVRAASMRALGHDAVEDERITTRLLDGLNDVSAWVRYFACQALGRRAVEAAAPRIEALLTDPAGQVRVAAVESLSHLHGEIAQRALRETVRGADPEMQHAALIGLGLSKHGDSVPLLLEATASPSAPTRLLALSALADHAPRIAVEALREAAADADEDVSAAAFGFLAELPIPEATQALIGLFATHRERVTPLLSKPAPARVAALKVALHDADERIAPPVAAALVRLRSNEAIDALLETLRVGNVSARKAAATALASLRTPAALSAIAAAADGDGDASVKQLCSILVGR